MFTIPKLGTETTMIVGIGGGFDVFVGLPLVYANPNCNYVLVNSSPNNDFHYRISQEIDLPEVAIEKTENIKEIYTVGRHGCTYVKQAYQKIIDQHQVKRIIAVDGGVDSLAVGDEVDPGTILEDFISLAALSDITVEKQKILCAAGFGTETEENVNHYRILENMSALTAQGGFLGSFSLTPHMAAFYQYKQQCAQAWANGRRKSHIQTKIISAASGNFGNDNLYSDIDARVTNSTNITFISLLSSIFWFFDLQTVIDNNKIVNELKKSSTFTDAKVLLRNQLKPTRSHEILPL